MGLGIEWWLVMDYLMSVAASSCSE